jgi:hypothetical protein
LRPHHRCAEKLRRRWIGIDITHMAISLIKTRLRDMHRERALVRRTPKVWASRFGHDAQESCD